MPAVSAVPVDLAVNAIIKYISYFSTDVLPEHSSPVWKYISEDLKGLWKVPAVRINICQNRRKILTIAQEKCGISIAKKENISPILNTSTDSVDHFNNTCDLYNTRDESIEEEDVSHDLSDGDDNDNKFEDFHVTISREQWNSMKRDKPFVYKGRKYYGFEPRVWTNIISFAFWEQYRLKCAFVFKRGKINKSGNTYAILNGRCRDPSCLNPVRGIIKNPPSDEGPVVITMKCRDTRYSKHADVKRPLNGHKRKEVQQKVLRSGVLGWRKEEAKNILKPGDTGSPFLYDLNTLHLAKKEALDKELEITPDDRGDTVLTIRNMNQDPQYMNSISWVGDTPFFVFYMTPTQLHTYAEYVRIHKQYSSINIDATGGLVRKLTESGDIFLYQIVINFDGTTVPVYQMLSEKHSANFISFWLSEWANKVTLPRQAVSDGSRALLNAMSTAFNRKNLKEYINFVFESLTTHSGLQPRTFIRLDTAHFLHTVSKWKCFQSVLHKIVKSFFLYCVALMIDCQTLSSLEEIFTLILIVCNTEFKDSIIVIDNRIITPREAKKKLEKLIAQRDLDLTSIDSLKVDPDKTLAFEESSQEAIDNKGWSVALLSWIDKICQKTNTIMFTGTKLNTHYVPELYGHLVENIKDFPLWSNVCTPETMLRPTSSYVETDFKDLKMNLSKKVRLPTSVINFLKLHIAYILGGVNIFNSKLTKFAQQSQKSKSKKIKYLQKSKGKNETAIDYDWTSDSVMQVSDTVEPNNSVALSENTDLAFILIV